MKNQTKIVLCYVHRTKQIYPNATQDEITQKINYIGLLNNSGNVWTRKRLFALYNRYNDQIPKNYKEVLKQNNL